MKKLWTLLMAVCFSAAMFAHEGYHTGDAAADFKLKSTDGKVMGFADFPKAQGFIVTFTCNHCPFSIAYEDRLIALHKKYADKGYPVIAINPNDAEKYPDDSYENMVVRAKEKKFPFVYLHDETQQIAKKYGATRTPHMFVIKKEGKDFIIKYIGAIDDNWENPEIVNQKYVEDAVNALLNNKEVEIKNTKAIGCTIKWKQ
jgi:peroxiredoxin